MLDRQVSDIAGFFADLDCIDSENWERIFNNYRKLIIEGKFHPYGNIFDAGYERLGFVFALFHEFEIRYLAQSDYMETIDHPNGDEVFAFELYDSIRKAALRRMCGDDVNIDCWNFFGNRKIDG